MIPPYASDRGIDRGSMEIAAQLSPEQVALLVIAIEQVGDVIADSRGVVGLHLNGDVADWDWLLGDWLDTYLEAAAPVKALRERRAAEFERIKNENWVARQAVRDSAAPSGDRP